jgi:acyl-CoA dehydrogenase
VIGMPLGRGGHDGAIDAIRAVTRDHLVAVAAESEPFAVDRRLVRALGEQGLLPRMFPSDLGGSRDGAVSAVELCRLREGVACESPAAETALALQGLGSYPILQSGRDEVVRRWIPHVAAGEAVAAFALTEPDAGSDAAALSLAAERDGAGYRLTGEKRWISNAPDADVYTVFARTTPDAGARGVTAFAVAGNSDGLTGERLRLLSPHAMGALRFDGVYVPEASVLGEVDAGFRVAMATLDLFRPSVGAFAVGMAQAALEAAVAHAAKRRTFGRPLREHQAVAHQLADMATRTQAARLLVYDAAATYDAGDRVTRQAAMAKLYATEAAQAVVDAALQIHGASGLAADHLLAHLYREVRAPRIYEGASEIQRSIIARELYQMGSINGGGSRPS